MSDKNLKEKIYKLKKINVEFVIQKFDGYDFIISNPKELLQISWAMGVYYEKGMIDFIRANYKGGSFVDAGSCIGNHSMAFSRVADKVYSFEPVLETFFQQALIISLNQVKNITTYNLALGNEHGIKPLFKDNYSSGGGRIGKTGNMNVVITKLDDFNIQDVKLIKVDVEGYELEMLKGSKNTILNHKPDLFVECATDFIFKDIWKFIKNLDVDYKVFPRRFNATPTFLFTTREVESFKKELVKES